MIMLLYLCNLYTYSKGGLYLNKAVRNKLAAAHFLKGMVLNLRN